MLRLVHLPGKAIKCLRRLQRQQMYVREEICKKRSHILEFQIFTIKCKTCITFKFSQINEKKNYLAKSVG